MGYNSKVEILTTNKGLQEMHNFTNQRIAKGSSNLLDNIDKKIFISNTDFQVIGWDRVKWYECYSEDVIAIMDSLKRLHELGIPYQYIRIGEDLGDVEEMCNHVGYIPYMCVNTTIEYEEAEKNDIE